MIRRGIDGLRFRANIGNDIFGGRFPAWEIVAARLVVWPALFVLYMLPPVAIIGLFVLVVNFPLTAIPVVLVLFVSLAVGLIVRFGR